MKKYKLNPKTWELPVGWLIGMIIVLPFIHITTGWLIYQSIGFLVCVIIVLVTLKKVDLTDVKKSNEKKVNEVYNGFYDNKNK